MNDRSFMETMLLLEKGACDLFLHGTIESATSSVHQAFSTALNDSLAMQDALYDQMADKGWYPTQQVEQAKVTAVKPKFSAQAQGELAEHIRPSVPDSLPLAHREPA